EPGLEIAQCAPGELLLALLAPATALRRVLDRRQQTEIHVHRLKASLLPLGRDVAAGDVREEGPERGRRRRRDDRRAMPRGGCEAAGQNADRGALDIALDAGDLAGKAQARIGLQPQQTIQQLRAVEEGVAVDASEAGELGLLQAG